MRKLAIFSKKHLNFNNLTKKQAHFKKEKI